MKKSNLDRLKEIQAKSSIGLKPINDNAKINLLTRVKKQMSEEDYYILKARVLAYEDLCRIERQYLIHKMKPLSVQLKEIIERIEDMEDTLF